jgi:hypothetical protein
MRLLHLLLYKLNSIAGTIAVMVWELISFLR